MSDDGPGSAADVMCAQVREALGALTDREWPALHREAIVTHLRACGACRRWQEQARAAARVVRAETPTPPVDLADIVIARLARRRRPGMVLLQCALFGVGAAAATLAVPALVFGRAEAPQHVAHELGALNVALALALMLSALSPRRSAGFLPVFGGLALLLLLTGGSDLHSGYTHWEHEVPHILFVVGFALLLLLTRAETARPPAPTPATRSPAASAPGAAAPSRRPAPRPGRRAGGDGAVFRQRAG
jgi:predicted anti-sigma-YlaC factor YlaD